MVWSAGSGIYVAGEVVKGRVSGTEGGDWERSDWDGMGWGWGDGGWGDGGWKVLVANGVRSSRSALNARDEGSKCM